MPTWFILILFHKTPSDLNQILERVSLLKHPLKLCVKSLINKKAGQLVVDEAHNYFPKPVGLMSRILCKYNPHGILLLSGTPSKFIKYNETNISKYSIHFVPPAEIQNRGLYSGVDIFITKVEAKKNPIHSIQAVWTDLKKNRTKWSKVLIACPNIEYAKCVFSSLTEIGINVVLSTCENDGSSSNMMKFKAGDFQCLIIVNRGLLGFNDPNIDLLIDMRSTTGSLDQNFQIFARILREAPDGRRKSYYRITNRYGDDFKKQYYMCHKLLAFMKPEIYTQFNGKNLYMKCG